MARHFRWYPTTRPLVCVPRLAPPEAPRCVTKPARSHRPCPRARAQMLESRRALVAIASALAIATGTGCAGVPDHGTVHAGNVLPAGKNVSETQSRVLVHGPVPGARPEEV